MKKKLITTIIAVSLAMTSTVAFAATQTSGNKVKSINPSKVLTTVNNNQGNVEYSKETISTANGKICSTKETWLDSITHNRRSTLTNNTFSTSVYDVENGTKFSKVIEYANGTTAKGSTVTIPSEEAANYFKSYDNGYFMKNLFTAIKDNYEKTAWKDEGVVTTTGGKVLNKISKTQISNEGDNASSMQEVNTVDYIYLDQSTGLPVKSETYSLKTGTMKLEFSSTFEYKNITNDGSIFDTHQFNLTNEKIANFEKYLPSYFGMN